MVAGRVRVEVGLVMAPDEVAVDVPEAIIAELQSRPKLSHWTKAN